MKKIFLLIPLALGALAGGLFFNADHVAPALVPSVATNRATPTRQTAAPATAGIQSPMPPRSAETAAVIPSARTTTTGRLARSALAQVIPSLRTPVSDWRAFTPAQLTVVPVPGLPLDFVAKSITTDGKRTTWIGTNGEQGASLVACATETLWDAIITVPGADEYSIQITPDSVTVLETAHGIDNCGQAATTTASLLVAPASQTFAAGSIQAAVDTTTLQNSDVLVLYSTGAKNNWGSTAEMENRIAAVVTAMNTYLEQSKVDNLHWRLVGTAEAPAYTTTAKLEDDLIRLADSSTELGRFAADQRTLYGADQVVLIVDGTRDYAGIAYTPGAFAVVHHPGSAATFAHELAHNFGCMHDRQTEKATDSDGKYYYGHRFTYNGQDTGTIMSYAQYLVPYFSNPSITYQGIPVGVAADQPKAADNARYLREHASEVANLRVSKAVTVPVITDPPTSVTVTAGQSFSLSATATGNQLIYQWSVGGVDIAGATSATYSKTSTAADGGSYTVLISNSAGSVRSNPVTVTVNPAPVPLPTPPASSSSGGGGGAFDLVSALGLLALLAGARKLRS